MSKSFSPSKNILANDSDFSHYIITSNVQSVFDLITANYKSGIRSFNLIGAYGTGKSSFLSAIESHLTGNQPLFIDQGYWKGIKSFEVVKLVGEYLPITEVVSEVFNSKSTKTTEILKSIFEFVSYQRRKGKGVLLLVDEFGKFLEYAAKHDPERELYFVQQLAEFVNNDQLEMAFIATLHQDMAAYSVGLNKVSRNEWIKVKGRFKEITFNEPVEQLIYLAGKHINGKVPEAIASPFHEIFTAVKQAGAFPLKDFFSKEAAEKLYPLDILSAAVLSVALQQYGQNERSLFTFLNSKSYLGFHDFDDKKSNFYSISHVFDFLNHNLNSFLKSKSNPDYSKWAEIRIALERCEAEISYDQQKLYFAVIKTIGLLNIFSHAGAKINEAFLDTYINNSDRLNGIKEVVADLKKKQIIRFSNHSQKFILFEGTDVDIDVAIDEAGLQLKGSIDVASYLSGYFSFPTISAKKAYFSYGTPRIFEYKITDTPYHQSVPQGEIDGFINLIFNDRISQDTVVKASSDTSEAILYGVFKNSHEIKEIIQEIQKAEIAKERHREDRIVNREASQIIDSYKSLLNHYVLGNFHNSDLVKWYFKGEPVTIPNSRAFNSQLSLICEQVYSATPVFKSELANRSKLSASISTARKSLIRALINDWKEENIGLNVGFPPEKSIYLSLLKETTIHRPNGASWILDAPTQETDPYRFLPLWEASIEFINSSKGAKRSIAELYEILSKRPFKLKKGFLDFWVPIFLYCRQADYALYGKNGFVPELDDEILELAVRNPKDYLIKAFDVAGVKIDLFNEYRILLNLSEETKTSSEVFIETIRPFIKFCRELPEYTRTTKRLSKQTLKVRAALIEATDPEKVFFEDFPLALGYDIVQLSKDQQLLKKYIASLQSCIKELRTAFTELLNRFEATINSLWNIENEFSAYKELLRSRYNNTIKQHLLLPYQKVFYQRVCSPLDDRNSWLSSVAQAVVGKSLERITDEDETKLHDRFLELVHELDNLNDITKQDINLAVENVFKLEITAPGEVLKNKIFRITKNKDANLLNLERNLFEMLSSESRFTRIALLAELLKKELDDEGK